MILHCDFEELTTLEAGAREYLESEARGVPGSRDPIAADEIEMLLLLLDGDLEVDTMEEQESLERAVTALLGRAKERMDETLLEGYVGAEDAVNAYFDYARVLTVHERVVLMGREMAAMIDLMTGQPATSGNAREIDFPE